MAANTHPDFLRALTPAQTAWLTANGIEATKDEVAGFWFHKGERFILPVRATDSRVYLQEVDRSEDGDGERNVAVFDRLRDALKALAQG